VPQTLGSVKIKGVGAGVYGEIIGLPSLRRVRGAKVDLAGANAKVQTDTMGTFFIPVNRPGTYAVQVSAPGYAIDVFTVTVRENQISDASRYLSLSERTASIPQIAWDEFDERLRWAQKTNYLFVPGGEIRRYSGTLRNAVEALGSRLGNGARLGEISPCVFLNGVPRPGLELDQVDIDEVSAIEVYGLDPWRASDMMKEGIKSFQVAWGPQAPCLVKPLRTGSGKVIIAFVSIWTR
jgi:hypothetical protein